MLAEDITQIPCQKIKKAPEALSTTSLGCPANGQQLQVVEKPPWLQLMVWRHRHMRYMYIYIIINIT